MRQPYEITHLFLNNWVIVPIRDTMKWISFAAQIYCALLIHISHTQSAYADAPPSYRIQNPLSWMHGLPTGEQPGWSQSWWLNFEISSGNTWNAPLIMNDLRTGRQYEYMADFEQSHAILEIGKAIGSSFAVSTEIPYAYRDGGAMDSTIDSFHVLINNRRFNRQYYPKNQNIFSVKTDGVDYYADNSYDGGISNVRLKLKYWFVKWLGQQKDSCPCGISISSQTKFPVQDESLGGTTGNIDQSVLLNFGAPLFSASSMWLTAGYTFLGKNPALENWPTNNYAILYEINFDFSLNQNWGLIMSARAESPFLNKNHLEYYDASSNPKIRDRNRAASGWNGLVYWRGSQALGLRYKTVGGSSWQFLIAEDWGVGPRDTKDNLYSNNSPDVSFIIQTQF